MARVQRRDPAAFGRLVERHVDGIHGYLTQLTRSSFDADELSQETFLRLWQRAGSYRPGRVRLTTWLHTIAHHLAVDSLRRRRAEPVSAIPEVADEAPGPEARLLAAEAGSSLQAALNVLPPNQRAAVLLCQVQGFSNRDAAAIIGVSVRSLESLLARARHSLRRALTDGEQHDAG